MMMMIGKKDTLLILRPDYICSFLCTPDHTNPAATNNTSGLELDFQWEWARVSGRPETVSVRFTTPRAICVPIVKVKGKIGQI